jgi:hypothetical protein
MEASSPRRSLQERFESTPFGRLLISVFILSVFVALLTANLPVSRLQNLLTRADHHYVYALGFDQSWGVFAPDPRQQTIDVTAHVTFEDGSKATWRVPRRDPVVGEYTDYRWLKWAEYVVSPIHSDLWNPIAAYVARQYATPNHRPREVRLTNRAKLLEPPGQKTRDQPLVQERTIATVKITDEMLRGS